MGVFDQAVWDGLNYLFNRDQYNKDKETREVNKQWLEYAIDKQKRIMRADGWPGVPGTQEKNTGTSLVNTVGKQGFAGNVPDITEDISATQIQQPQPYMHDRNLPTELSGGQMGMGNFPSAGVVTPGFGIAGTPLSATGTGAPALASVSKTGITGQGGPVYTDGPRIEDPNKAFADLMAAVNMGSFQTPIDSSRFKGGFLRRTCCFIFIAEHEGRGLHPVVRWSRDEFLTERMRRGYYRLADMLVPRMQRSKGWMQAVRNLMVRPMTHYGKWRYGFCRSGIFCWPVNAFWFMVFRLMGLGGPYRRKGTDEVV